MALRGVMGKRVVQDVVELEPAVLQVAQNFFGVCTEHHDSVQQHRSSNGTHNDTISYNTTCT